MLRFTRFVLSSSVIIAAALAPCLALAAPDNVPLNPSGFAIHRGTNLSHWLSQDFGWAPRTTVITENDIRFLARTGFDHVRLPLDEKEMWLADGRPNEEAFALLRTGIGWCLTHKLRVIVDLHTVHAHHFNADNEGLKNTLWKDPTAQEKFIALWREISARLHELPVDAVAYEIMNEPTAGDHEDWNRLVATTFAFIRSAEPQRVIIVGSNLWQMPSTFPALKVPAGDKNIILSMHTYSPMLLTHYRADWTPLKIYTGPVKYPGPVVDRATFDGLMKSDNRGLTDITGNAADDWGPARMQKEFEPAIRRARELGLQLHCGEFGCVQSAPRADRLAYYRDLIGVFEANGIAWANWEYKGDFGLLEWHSQSKSTGAPDQEMIAALFGKR